MSIAQVDLLFVSSWNCLRGLFIPAATLRDRNG